MGEFSEQQIDSFMERALELASQAGSLDEVPVGAVLVSGNEILAEGLNRRESTQRTLSHAELVALESFNARFSQWRVPPGTSLFVTAEPCLMCTGALLWARVDNVYFGCSDTKNAGLSRISNLIHAGVYDHRFTEVRGGILGDRCAELLSGYFRGKRKNGANPVSPQAPMA